MAGRRTSLASLAGEEVETVPGASRPDLIHVHPNSVAPTPLNPRRVFDDTELAELGEGMRSGQLQPCVAVARTAYLKLYPEHANQLPNDCRYVMAAGERRWRAALRVGLSSLDLMLRHDLTETRVRFLSAVLSENVQRANFNPIEEADGLRAMLELHDGNQSAAAKAMGKSKAWFNQRIGLLRLTDEMVQLVLDGSLTAFRDMRRYASLPPGDQYAAWKQDQERPPALPKADPVPTPPQVLPVQQPVVQQDEPQTYTAVYTPTDPDAQQRSSGPAENHGVISHGKVTAEAEGTSLSASAVPEPRTAAPTPVPVPEPAPAPAPVVQRDPGETAAAGRRLEFDRPGEVAMLLDLRMEADDTFFELLRFLGLKGIKRDPDRLAELARTLAEKAETRTP